MLQISKRVSALSPSATLAMLQKTNELKAAGVDVIGLTAGEPDFNTPDHIKEAAKKAIDENYSRYTPVSGYLSLRKAICDKLQRENGLMFTPDQIVVGNGAKHELANVVLTMVNPGDEVIIPTPAWVSYVELVKLAEGVPVCVPTLPENGLKLTAEQLEAAITPRTRLMILCTPSNPTGAVYTAEELEALAAVLVKHPDVTVLSDEIYAELTYLDRHVSIASLPGMWERTVLISGFSKSHAMTGWRIGYACGPEVIIRQMLKIHQFAIMCAPTTSQYAAVEAMKNGDEDVEMMREEYNGRRRYLMKRFADMGLDCFEPFGAFYTFPCIKEFGMTSDEFATKLLNAKKVAVVPGTAFGDCGEGFLRISYAYSLDDLKRALDRIEEFITELRAKKHPGEEA